MTSRWLTGGALGLLVLAGEAVAQPGVLTSQASDGGDLGKVAQTPSASSVWRIDADTGEVTLVSGDAVRLTSGPSSPPMIVIECANARCRGATITAAFAPSSAGQATIVGFNPGTVTGKGLTLSSTSGAGTTHLLMTFVAGGDIPARATFPLGMTVRLSTARGAPSPNYGYTLVVNMH